MLSTEVGISKTGRGTVYTVNQSTLSLPKNIMLLLDLCIFKVKITQTRKVKNVCLALSSCTHSSNMQIW